jgi:uncharacterized membrane protein
MPEYLLAKLVHVLLAVLALGTSAGLGIVLELYGDHPAHGGFVLRAVGRVVAFFVLPGYALVLASGLWTAHGAWPMTAPWIRAAMALWGVGLLALAASLAAVRRQARSFESDGPASPRYRRIAWAGRALGAATGLVVIALLYLMVFKPGG